MPRDPHGPWHLFIQCLALLLLIGCLPARGAGGTGPPVVVVLYPQTVRPYSAVFAEILEGISQRLDLPDQRRYALGQDDDPRAVKEWIEHQSAEAVITLGSRAAQTYAATGLSLPQVIGALDASPQTHAASGVSLAVDPPLLFATLKRLLPEVKEVYVVFDPQRDRWLIDRAQRAAARYQLTLRLFEASDLRTAARHFWTILKTAPAATAALWLLMDGRLVDDRALLPVIIEQSWHRRLPVFSANLLHVNRGVLFALYPDNEALGRRLADRALRLAADPDASSGIEALRDVKRALNLRVSAHLGLAVDAGMEQEFDLVLPPR